MNSIVFPLNKQKTWLIKQGWESNNRFYWFLCLIGQECSRNTHIESFFHGIKRDSRTNVIFSYTRLWLIWQASSVNFLKRAIQDNFGVRFHPCIFIMVDIVFLCFWCVEYGIIWQKIFCRLSIVKDYKSNLFSVHWIVEVLAWLSVY